MVCGDTPWYEGSYAKLLRRHPGYILPGIFKAGTGKEPVVGEWKIGEIALD